MCRAMLACVKPPLAQPFLIHLPCSRPNLSNSKPSSMSTIQVHYDGWLALPEAVRRKLGVGTGDRLEVEVADGTVVLRPARRADTAGQAVPEPAVAAEQSVEVVPEPEPAPTAGSGTVKPRPAASWPV